LLRLYLFPIFASFAAGQNPGKIFLTEDVVFLVPPEQKAIFSTVARQTAASAAELEILFGKPAGTTEIIAVRSLTDILHLSGIKPPEWSRAIALPDRNRIYIRIGKPEDLEQLPGVILHELVHLHLAGLDKNNHLAWWLHEGMADLFSGEDISFGKSLSLSWQMLGGSKPDLTKLVQPGAFSGSGAGQAYTLALSATIYFSQNYGRESMIMLVRQIGAGENVDSVFVRQTGENFAGFNRNWQVWLKKRYSGLALIGSDALIWIFILLLLALAYSQIKRRNNQKISSWEDEYLEKN